MTFRTLLNGHDTAEIICPIKKEVVRTLRRIGFTSVQIECADGTKTYVQLETPIRYEPWVFDRGNLLFNCPLTRNAKLCTEMDIIKFKDGTQKLIQPS